LFDFTAGSAKRKVYLPFRFRPTRKHNFNTVLCSVVYVVYDRYGL